MDLLKMINAKRHRESDMREKLNNRAVATLVKTIIPIGSIAQATVSMQKGSVIRYQTPFSQKIKEIEPPKKFTPLKFTLYDGKSDLRSRQILALWNHMDALMCRVFPLSLGDLGLKWFDKLPTGSIESFHQFTESFIARFIINTKAPKGVGFLLMLKKCKNESIQNYSKRY